MINKKIVTIITNGHIINQEYNEYTDGYWRYPEHDHLIYKDGNLIAKHTVFNKNNIPSKDKYTVYTESLQFMKEFDARIREDYYYGDLLKNNENELAKAIGYFRNKRKNFKINLEMSIILLIFV